MAAGRIVLPPYMPTRNRDGLLVDQARLTVYENETTVKATIYSDEALTVLQANPVIANSSGQFPPIWAEAGTTESPVLYSLAIADSSGASVGNPGVFDNWQPSVDGETAASALAEAAAESAAESAAVAEDALAEILAAAAAAPETLPLLNKANLDGANVSATGNALSFRESIGAFATDQADGAIAATLLPVLQSTGGNDTSYINAAMSANPGRNFTGSGDTFSTNANLSPGFAVNDGFLVDTRYNPTTTPADDYGVTVFGWQAAANNVYEPGIFPASGGRMFAAGNCIVAFGYKALHGNTTGRRMAAFGYRSLHNNTTGYYNTGLGSHTLESCSTGYQNTAGGVQSLQALSTGHDNSGYGSGSGVALGTGSYNTLLGSEAGRGITNGNDNVALGYQALGSLGALGMSNNVAIGSLSARLFSGNDSVFIGYRAGYEATGTAQVVGIGKDSLVSMTTGQDNTAVGYQSLQNITTQSFNTAFGSKSLANCTAAENTAVGYQAGASVTTATRVVAVGHNALRTATTGNGNTALGWRALELVTDGANNLGIGAFAGSFLTTGGGNVFVGQQAGVTETTGVNSTYLGNLAGANASGVNNSIAIGYQCEPTKSNQATLGHTTITETVLRGVVQMTTYTVGTLPSGTVGMRAFVTDATGPTFGSTVVGGGSTPTPVYSDGTNWKVG